MQAAGVSSRTVDYLFQLVLGASVGVATMGRRTGVRKAALWGGMAGILPDLDVLIDHGNALRNMVLHRAESHALFWPEKGLRPQYCSLKALSPT